MCNRCTSFFSCKSERVFFSVYHPMMGNWKPIKGQNWSHTEHCDTVTQMSQQHIPWTLVWGVKGRGNAGGLAKALHSLSALPPPPLWHQLHLPVPLWWDPQGLSCCYWGWSLTPEAISGVTPLVMELRLKYMPSFWVSCCHESPLCRFQSSSSSKRFQLKNLILQSTWHSQRSLVIICNLSLDARLLWVSGFSSIVLVDLVFVNEWV